jgi:hypothetical protein
VAVVVHGLAQHPARGRRKLARGAFHVAARVQAVFLHQLAALVVAHQAHEDAVLELLLAHQLAAVAVLAAHQAGLAGRRVAVGGVHVLAVELAVLHRLRREGQQGEQSGRKSGRTRELGHDGSGGEDGIQRAEALDLVEIPDVEGKMKNAAHPKSIAAPRRLDTPGYIRRSSCGRRDPVAGPRP